MGEAVIKLKKVTKKYRLYKSNQQRLKALFFRGNCKRKTAVDKASFTIGKGETVAFIGNNGAGKSTLMKMIAGVSFPTAGEIETKGNINAILDLRAGFDPEFTGRQNLYLRGRILGWSEKEIKEHEEEIISFAELGEYVDQPVRTYSSGMAARLGFAINTTMKPEILIIDEAMGVGDKAFRVKCIDKLKAMVADESVTLLFVSSSMPLNRKLCERGIVINESRIEFDGPINEAIRFYEDNFVKKTEQEGETNKDIQLQDLENTMIEDEEQDQDDVM